MCPLEWFRLVSRFWWHSDWRKGNKFVWRPKSKNMSCQIPVFWCRYLSIRWSTKCSWYKGWRVTLFLSNSNLPFWSWENCPPKYSLTSFRTWLWWNYCNAKRTYNCSRNFWWNRLTESWNLQGCFSTNWWGWKETLWIIFGRLRKRSYARSR